MLLPFAMPFTCQVRTVFVPLETNAENWKVDTTGTDTVAGEIVTLIPVVASVHEEFDVAVDEVEVVVVQVTAGVAAVPPHEAKPSNATNKIIRKGRRLTAPPFSLFDMPNPYGSGSTLLLKMRKDAKFSLILRSVKNSDQNSPINSNFQSVMHSDGASPEFPELPNR
jgi:hypothetical protein